MECGCGGVYGEWGNGMWGVGGVFGGGELCVIFLGACRFFKEHSKYATHTTEPHAGFSKI